jgi:hypothetical protein
MSQFNYYSNSPDVDGPSDKAYVVTPSDGVDLTETCRKLTCTGAGNVSLITASGDIITISIAVGFEWASCYFSRVRASGTTATGLVAYR